MTNNDALEKVNMRLFYLRCHKRRTVVNQEIKVIADIQPIKRNVYF